MPKLKNLNETFWVIFKQNAVAKNCLTYLTAEFDVSVVARRPASTREVWDSFFAGLIARQIACSWQFSLISEVTTANCKERPTVRTTGVKCSALHYRLRRPPSGPTWKSIIILGRSRWDCGSSYSNLKQEIICNRTTITWPEASMHLTFSITPWKSQHMKMPKKFLIFWWPK